MSDDDRLRKEARRRLERHETKSRADLAPEELLEELTVHGIELEMQTDELVRTGEALARSRDAFADLFEMAPIGFVVLDETTRITRINQAARTLMGDPPLGTSFVAMVRKADMSDVTGWLRMITRKPIERDLALVDREGTPHVVHVHARRDDQEQVLLSLVDVTHEREVSAALEERERDLRRLTDLAPDAVCVVGGGVIVYSNHRFEDLIRVDRGKLQGAMLRNLVHAEDREALDLFLAHATQSSPRAPIRFVDGGGGERMVELRTMRFVFRGQPSVLLIGRDLTDRRRLQARVERAERLATVGMLVAGVAHEVNNPLSYCMSNLEVLATRLKDTNDEDLLEAVRDALSGAGRVKNIVADLRAFNRVDDELTVLEPNRVVMQAIRMAERETKARARLRRDLGAVPNITANENRLVQVVVNLVVNASQAMTVADPADNWIRVRTWPANDEVCIAIEDNGPGISEENLKKVFDPFFTTRRTEGGTGLGLAICNSLVQQMGGFIEVDSTVGKGTRFVLRLPASTKKAAQPPRRNTPRRLAAQRRLKLVVIDDERAIIRSIRRLLSDIADVEDASSGRAGIALIEARTEPIDLVLCDLVMTDGTGEDVADWLREARPNLMHKLVFMSGMAHPSVRRQLDAPVLAKPFTREALEQVLARVSPAWSNPPIAMGNEE